MVGCASGEADQAGAGLALGLSAPPARLPRVMVQHAPTARGFGVALLHSRGWWLVGRTFGGRVVVVSRHRDESAARAAANRLWVADRA
jgi:hypothetical protein